MAQNDIDYQVNFGDVIRQVREMDKAFADLEKGIVGGGEHAQKTWASVSDTFIKANDRNIKAQERWVRSIEQGAAAAGKSGVEKLIAKRDEIIKRLGTETMMVERVTKAYAQYIKIEEESRKKKPGESNEQTLPLIGRSLRDLYEGRTANSTVALGKAVAGLTGFNLLLGGAAVAIGAVGAAGLSSASSLAKFAEETENVKLRTGFTTKEVAGFGYAARATGQDIEVFERGMRGLTQAVEDQSSAGDKARAWLVKFGVDIRAVREGSASTGDVFRAIATGINQLPPGVERAKAQMDLFKRTGIELIPVLNSLNKNLATAERRGFGPNDQDLERFAKIHEQQKEIEEAWEDFKRKVIQDKLSIPVLFILRGVTKDTDQSESDLFGNTPGTSRFGRPSNTTDIFGRGNIRYPDPNSVINGVQGAIDRRRANAAVSGYIIGEGDEAQLREAERLRTNLGKIQLNVSSEADVKGAVALDRQIEGLKERIRLTGKVKENEEAIREAQVTAVELARYPNGVTRADQQLINFAKRENVADEQVNRYRETLIPQFRKDQQESIRRAIAVGHSDPTFQQQEITASELIRLNNEQQAAQSRGAVRDIQRQGRSLSVEGRLLEAQARSSDLSRESSARLGSALSDNTPANRLRLERDLAQIKLEASDREYQKNVELYKYEEDSENMLKALRLEHENEVATLRSNLDERHAQEVRAQIDKIKGEVQGLLTTAITHPSQFFGQLGTTVRDAALRPITNSISERIATGLHPLIYGSGGGTLQDVKLINNSVPVTIVGTTMTHPASSSGAPWSYGKVPASSSLSDLDFARKFLGVVGASGNAPSFRPQQRTGVSSNITYITDPGTNAPSLGGAFSPSLPSFSTGSSVDFGDGAIDMGGGIFNAGSPGGTSGFSGPVGGGSGGGINGILGGIFGGGGKSGGGGGGLNIGSLGGLFSGKGLADILQGTQGGGPSIPLGGGAATTAGSALSSGPAFAGGILLAGKSLLGSWRGTKKGILGGAAGGALIGFRLGGPIGAAIGAAVGFGIGLGEYAAGVETPERQAIRLAQETYGIKINDNAAKQIVGIAKEKYGGNIGIAIRAPEVRDMLSLYSAGTGQAGMPLSATTPHGSSFVNSGGSLMQQSVYQYGRASTYQSALPIYGGGGGGGTAASAPIQMSFNVAGDSVDRFMSNQVFTPTAVATKFKAGLASSVNRVQNTLTQLEPGTIAS